MKKVLIIGSQGMLGSTAVDFFTTKNFSVVGVDKSAEFDFTDKNHIKNLLKKNKPDVVINCAAFTNVDACETTTGLSVATTVNAQAPVNLVEICLNLNIHCVHISTDYVFGDNVEFGHIESDIPIQAMNAYGHTKLAAEQGIIILCGGLDSSNFQNQNASVYIIRISWLFGHGGKNFLQKILVKAETELALKVVTDEIGCPTYTQDVIKTINYILENKLATGIYHVISRDICSRYDFAQYALEKINSQTVVQPCKLSDFPRVAKINNFSILKNTKLPEQRSWREMVDDFLAV